SAQAEAARRGVTNIHFRQCSANDLPFETCTFDVAVGRLSAMFFADPVAAVREALRVVLEDGSVAFAVWGPNEANPFFSTVTDVIDRFLGGYPQNSDAPDTFRFAVPGELAGILEQADAKNVIERQLNFRQGPVENSLAILRIAAGDERVTHVAAQRMLRPIRRKTQRDQWLHTYRAVLESRFHRPHAAKRTRNSSLHSRPIAAR